MKSGNPFRVLFAGLALIVLAALACNLPGQVASQTQAQTPIPVTTEAVGQVQQQLEQAATQIAGNPGDQPVTVVFTEEQLTSMAAYSLGSVENPPLTDPQVRLRDGQAELSGKTEQQGISLPVTVVMTVSPGSDGSVHAKVISAKVGPLPLPESMQQDLTKLIDGWLNDSINSNSHMAVESVVITDGKLTATGRPRP